ncbi:MAG: DUF4127 family protein [bacterium]
MVNILIIPIDNRPVCYDLPVQIANICSDANVFIPPKEYLGGLTNYANYDGILHWVKKTTAKNQIDYAILALDTIAYGGLVASRRIEISQTELQSKVEYFISEIKKSNAKILATSSIMRISNNNVNEEEKSYWDTYGEKIFKYSFEFHKNGIEPEHEIPPEILEDYLSTRKRNYETNLFFLSLLEKNLFDFLVISQDDTAQFGLNVKEGQELAQIIEKGNLSATIKTGADEIPLTLLARAFCDFYKEKIKITPIYSIPESKNIISRYEDVTIENSFLGQISICEAKATLNGDFSLYINTPAQIQDDLAMQIFKDTEGVEFKEPKEFYAIADIKLANGSDNTLIKKLLESKCDDKLLGYAGWNTTANTLGCVLSTSIVSYIAKKNNTFNKESFKRAIATRLLDEWAYQANLRQEIRKNPEFDIEQGFIEYIQKVQALLDLEINGVSFYFPWDRTFEVGICLE